MEEINPPNQTIYEVIKYAVAAIITWCVWASKQIIDLNKKEALNKQADEAALIILKDIRSDVKVLTESVNGIMVTMAENGMKVK